MAEAPRRREASAALGRHLGRDRDARTTLGSWSGRRGGSSRRAHGGEMVHKECQYMKQHNHPQQEHVVDEKTWE